ncbi:MAG: YfcC family protein [Candidatus Cyclobacteriaceae bacterium M3_2C_046]
MLKKLPDTLIIVLSILLIFTALTWIIPAGSFDRELVNGRELVVPGSYQPASSNPQGFFDFLKAPVQGFISAAQIIAFVLIVGGAFSILNRSGAIDAGLRKIIDISLKYPRYKKLMVALLVVLFSLAGATFGMSEEVLVFILITLPLAFSLGYDSITGVAIPFVGAGAGFAGAFTNPFTIGIAQGIAELPPFSGWEYRLVVWLIFTMAAVGFILQYVIRLEESPEISPVYQIDQKRDRKERQISSQTDFSISKKVVLIIFALSLVLLVYGVNNWDWYINEIAALFLGLGIVAALITKMSTATASEAFIEGAKDMIYAAMVIALSKGILIIASEGQIIDTVLFHLSNLVEGFHRGVAVELMFFVQAFLNFFLPSGSGQAALTMPVMAPLSDLLEISRQTAVLAFQFGDGISNLVIPTSGVTMGVLGISKIPYQKWLTWIWPLMLILVALAMVLLLLPVVAFSWGPF